MSRKSGKGAVAWFSIRFSVRTLFFVALCVAGLLAGMRWGYVSGIEAGQRQRKKEAYVTRVYPVADLVLHDPIAALYVLDPVSVNQEEQASGNPVVEPEFEDLMMVIEEHVRPDSWETHGGEGSIQEISERRSLAVTQSPAAHKEIDELLIQLRKTWALTANTALRHGRLRLSPP